jgi:transposase-like protein
MGELPPANIKRWVVRRKAAAVAAVQSGKITLEEACRRYQLSKEEFRAWQRAYEAHGLRSLRAPARSSIAPRRGPAAAGPCARW